MSIYHTQEHDYCEFHKFRLFLSDFLSRLLLDW
jgi:hypothetical protein